MINQQDKKKDSQFLYMGRWVDKSTFRAFVYNVEKEQKLAESYAQYKKMIESGIWFNSAEDAQASSLSKEAPKVRKPKHGADGQGVY